MDNDEILIGCLGVVIMLCIIAGVIMLQFYLASIACNQKANALGYKSQYGIF